MKDTTRHFLNKKMLEGRDLCFVVGGAYGFSKEVYKAADTKLSLSAVS